MKKTSIYVIIFLLIVSLCGCDKGNENETNEKKTNEIQTNESITKNSQSNHDYILSIDKMPIDNDTDIKSAMMQEHSLSELNDYFGDYSSQERGVYEIEYDDLRNLRFEDVNDSFPVTNCRFNSNSCYSTYKVKEGGFFYIFFEAAENYGICVADTFYIKELKNITDFDVLQQGASTYEDVYAIDSASELILALSNGIYSYSLLDNERILEIKYSSTDLRGRNDLIVEKTNIESVSDSFSYLSSIFKKDLP